jgi:hypothetical protein
LTWREAGYLLIIRAYLSSLAEGARPALGSM